MKTNLTAGRPGFDRPVRLTELLAGYLLASPWIRYPGADGLLLDEVIAAEYAAAFAAGHVPGPGELVRRHPDLADVIGVFFRRSGNVREG